VLRLKEIVKGGSGAQGGGRRRREQESKCEVLVNQQPGRRKSRSIPTYPRCRRGTSEQERTAETQE